MKTTYRRIDEMMQDLIAEDHSANHDRLARELAEVLDYQHEHDFMSEELAPLGHLDLTAHMPEGRMADPHELLLRPVR